MKPNRGRNIACSAGWRDGLRFYLSLPMTFNKIVNGAGKTVSGVPVDGEFYS